MKEEIRILMCELADSLVRNVNDNFINVSFDIMEDGFIQTKIILKNQTDIEDDYIDDIAAEFSAVQEKNIINKFEVTTDIKSKPLKYTVLSKIS